MSSFETNPNMSKKKRSLRLFPILFLVSLVLAIVFCVFAALQTLHLQQTKAKLSSAQGEVSRTNSELQIITKKYNDVSSQLAK